MKAYADLGDLPEDERIRLAAETALLGNVVGVVTDDEPGKPERYIWARKLMEEYGMNEKAAIAAAGGEGYPFKMQDDLIERGEWDETGARYRQQKPSKSKKR